MIELMRERIMIQKNESFVDENGNHLLQWKDYYSCATYANHLSGDEYYAAAQNNTQDEIVFTIRFCTEVKSLDTDHYRILFQGEVFDIHFIDNVQFKNRTLKIRASKVRR